MKRFLLLISFVLVSCLKIDPSPFDTSKNVNALILEILLLMGTGNQIATPTFNPSAGYYATVQNISISTTTSGATIYYTTDGSTPTSSSTQYTSSMHIWSMAGKTIKAIATKPGYTDSAVISGVFSYATLKTGVTQCWDQAAALISCTGTKQDGELQIGVPRSFTGPTAHSTYTSDYTTTDNATGLVWKTCTQGLSGPACATGTAQMLINDGTANDATNDPTWGCNALNSANSGNGYAGIKTWRLPTRREIGTLANISAVAAPFTYVTAFPATQTNYYWSSTISPADSTLAYGLDFGNGAGNSISPITRTNVFTNYARCVSGTANNPTFNYTDNGDNTIKDNTTGLTWQKCMYGQNNDATCSGTRDTTSWDVAMANCNGQSFAGRSWRLPNILELETLFDATKTTSARMDTITFPNAAASNHRTSNSYPAGATGSFVLLIGNGVLTVNNKTVNYAYRCVTGP